MSDTALGMSVALGFWTKHAEAMDAIYEYEDSEDGASLPKELAAIKDDPVAGPQIDRLTIAAENDCDRFLRAVDMEFRKRLGADTLLKIEQKRIIDWSKRIELRAKRDRSKMRIVLGISIDTGSTAGMMAQCTLWTPGGKAAEERNAKLIFDRIGTKPRKGLDDNETSWDSGLLVLSRVAFKNFLTGDRMPSVDLDKLLSALVAGAMQACPADAYFPILKAGR